jgi:actin related protein 2/3 complex subunit 1A/1B
MSIEETNQPHKKNHHQQSSPSIITKMTTPLPPVLTSTISCHTWNKDKSQVAISPNNSDIEIYSTNGQLNDFNKWTLEYTLTEHDHHVTALDWAPNTNRILSCSQDRNAYVWNFDDKEKMWKPTLVLLRINRAATCCKWSPKENKFAVGSGAKCVCVCCFEEENNWWVSKLIKKPHKSTILNLAWHPTDNTLLATASSDFKARVFSAWIKSTDGRDKKAAFGEMINEYVAKGWVHDTIYSPSGNTFAFIGHDSSVTFVMEGKELVVRSPELPFLSGLFLSDKAFIAVGYDYSPAAFSLEGSVWKLKGKIDTGDDKKTDSGSSGVKSAFAKFQTQSRVGTQNLESSSSALKTRHTNVINCINPLK